MAFTLTRWTAIAMAAVEIAIHAVLAPNHLQEKLYVGVLFVVAGVLLTAVLISLLVGRMRLVGWLLGVSVCAGMFVGFLLSRTTGLPDGYREWWTSDGGLGIVSLPPELVFIACAANNLRVHVAVYDAENAARHDSAQVGSTRIWSLNAAHPERRHGRSSP